MQKQIISAVLDADYVSSAPNNAQQNLDEQVLLSRLCISTPCC
jgi:hypothetical protein